MFGFAVGFRYSFTTHRPQHAVGTRVAENFVGKLGQTWATWANFGCKVWMQKLDAKLGCKLGCKIGRQNLTEIVAGRLPKIWMKAYNENLEQNGGDF